MIVVIPARLASTRLPRKPLLDVAGKPLIRRVYEQAKQVQGARVVVATDTPEIAQAVEAFGGEVCMTAADHTSGTDRIAEAATLLRITDDEIIVNWQGDEPLMPPALVASVAERLASDTKAAIATACHPISDPEEFQNPNAVKVVLDASSHALYFSRAPIPWPRDSAAAEPFATIAHRHIGLYAYRAGFVRRFAALPPCPLERRESLEQLRALWHGYRIAVVVTDSAPVPGVDTPDDLARVRRLVSDNAG